LQIGETAVAKGKGQKQMCIRSRTFTGLVFLFLRKTGDEERGAELFEFALVVPVLLTLLLGVFWMGRAYNVYETITRAAREGARYAVLPSSMAQGNTFPDP
jgi:Flp pilus assembly protein TadG